MKSLHTIIYVSCFCFLVFLGNGCGSGNTSITGKTETRPAVYDFTLKNLNNENVSLSDYRGKPILIDFWATWCLPCVYSMPELEKIHEEYKDKGVQVLGINLDEDIQNVPPFVKNMKITYPILLGAQTEVSHQYRLRGIPTFILLDQEGRLVKKWPGYAPNMPQTWRKLLDQLIKESL